MINKALALLLLPFLTGGLSAETFYLKNGKKIVGKKTSDDGKEIEIEYYPEPGAKDWITVKRSNIRKITREDIEAAQMLLILELQNTPDLQKGKWYQEQIDKIIKPFYKDFPRSRNERKVEVIEKALLAEMKTIEKGGVKIDGVLLKPEERESQAYDVDSLILAKEFKDAKKQGKFGNAFAAADKLGLDFPRSKAYGSVVIELPRLAAQYRRVLLAAEQQRKQQVAAWDRRKAKLSPAKIAAKERENKLINAQFKAKIDKERAAGKKWLTINPISEESIKNELEKIEAYIKNVTKIVEDYQEVDAGKHYKMAYDFIVEKKFAEAREQIDRLSVLGINEGYYGKIDEFWEEQKDIEKQAEKERRYGEVDLMEKYLNIDDIMLETILECNEYMKTMENEATAKLLRGRLRVFTSRMKRIYKNREKLGTQEYFNDLVKKGLVKPEDALKQADIESLNAELSIKLGAPLKAFNENKAKLLKEKKHLGLFNEQLEEFISVLPNPEDYLSERAKLAILRQKEAELAGNLTETAIATALGAHSVKLENGELVPAEVATTTYYILYFAGSESPQCIKELPDVQAIYDEKIGQHAHVDFLMFARDENPANFLKWAKAEKFSWSIIPRAASDKNQGTWDFWKHKGNTLPEYVLINKNGELVKKGTLVELMEEVEKGVQQMRENAAKGIRSGLTDDDVRKQVKDLQKKEGKKTKK